MLFHGALIGLLGRRVARGVPLTVGQTLAGALTVLVVAYGVCLRFDAITLKYGPVRRPSWLRAVQQTRGPASLLRPPGMTWTAVPTYPHRDGPPTRYASDSYTYLRYAREMGSFYAAHRREPLFPFVTKVFLRLLRNQDVAVSFASAAFSVLAIIGTLALGWYAFSWWVGLGAALALAIEYDVVSWGVEGWRNDAFMCAVLLSAYVMLRCARVLSTWNACLVGISGGLACLVRITALSFLAPGLAFLLIAGTGRWRERLKGVGLAALIMTAIVAPFAINCWLTFGDPLYAINVHADVYRLAEGEKVEASQTAVQYLGNQARSRPMLTLDTFVLGMTTYPFLNKWGGFSRWVPWLGAFLSWAAVAGLLLLIGSLPGRLLFVVLAGSLVPYAFTWKVGADWRFTEHAYPFFLIAACLAIGQVVTLAASARLPAVEPRSPRLEAAGVLGIRPGDRRRGRVARAAGFPLPDRARSARCRRGCDGRGRRARWRVFRRRLVTSTDSRSPDGAGFGRRSLDRAPPPSGTTTSRCGSTLFRVRRRSLLNACRLCGSS